MKRVKELVVEIMERYSAAVEGACAEIGECAENVIVSVKYYGKYLWGGLVVAFAWLLLAVTMPVWYLPYKYFCKK